MPLTLPVPTNGPTMNAQAFGANVQQGSQVYIHIGSKAVGYITQLSESESYGTEAFYSMGDIMPKELQALRWSGSLTVNGAVLYNGSWQAEFMYPGSAILQQGAVNISVYNKVLGKMEKVYVGCVPTSYNKTQAANAYSLQNGVWLYRDIQVLGINL